MFVTLTDFDSRWGVDAGGNDGNKAGEGGGGRVFERFRSHIILKSRIWSTLLMFATLFVIFRSRVLIIYLSALL